MYKARKYRIYPTNSQKELIHKHCGSVRFLYNLALETKTMVYLGSKVNLSRYDLQKQVVDLKKELPWLKEINSQSLQVAILDLDTAYSNFFKGRAGFPKFKKKSNRGIFNVPQNVIVENDLLIIPKFKEGIKIKLHRDLVGTIKQATVSFTPTGKYFVSILCDTDEDFKPKQPIKEESSIGIDLGIKDFLVTSEGEVIDNPKFLRNSIQRLKVLQRRASKKQKGSQNRKKANKRVSILHEKIKNQRQDFLHKTSTKLIRENQTICLESLDISNMVKNQNLAQAISDVGWGEFNRMIEYKAEWYGVNILRIGRFAPSSKTCECGKINKDLKLSDRIWECKSCGRVNERDFLAANNIKKFALKDYSGQGLPVEPVEMSTLVESEKQEAQPIASGVGGWFTKYIERFDLKKHDNNELKEHKKETCNKVQGSLKGFNYLISVEEGCVFLKGNETLLFKTNKNYIDFKITSNKVFYIDKPLYISNKILIKREAGNCFNVKIYENKEGEEDISLNVIFESSFSSNKKILLKLKKRCHEL